MKCSQNMGLNVLLILVLVSNAGCVPLLVGAAAGAGGITYAKGAMVKNVDATVKKSHKATVKALKNLKMFIISDELNSRKAVVKAEFDDGQEAKIFIDAITELVSKITIRVGILGDQDSSQVIMNAIEKQL